MAKSKGKSTTSSSPKPKRVLRREFPVHSLDQALVIAEAVMTQGAGRPMDRILVAKAVGRTPSSSEFKLLLSSSIKYGLTEGSEKADKISPLPLAKEIFRPLSDDEKLNGLRKAVLNSDLCRRILEHYNNSALPNQSFFQNALEREFGVPADHSAELSELLHANAVTAKILEDVSGKNYVMLSRSVAQTQTDEQSSPESHDTDLDIEIETAQSKEAESTSDSHTEIDLGPQPQQTKVFISHGKDHGMLENVKAMLTLADLDYEIAVESETTAIPVPEKIKEAMRRCNAALICVGDENGDGTVNQNVLIEIGAAFVLYDQRVVLLWNRGLSVPSNLQGLYRCEVEGADLSFADGMKLMATLKNFKPTS